MKAHLPLIYIFLIFFCFEASSIGLKEVREYPNTPLSNAKTWDIDIYDDSWAYFATEDGLVQYDGSMPRIFQLNNRNPLRSVNVDGNQGRVYVSGINEFGYFVPSTETSLKYVCLSDSVGEDRQIGNIWGIYPGHGSVMAQGDGQIIIYDEKTAEHKVVNAGMKLDCSNVIDGVMWLGTDRGLKFLMGSAVTAAPGAGDLDGIRIRSILPFGNGILVVTADKGIYSYDRSSLTRLEGASLAAMRLGEVFSADIHDDILALGSIDNGVGVVDLTTGNMHIYDEENGLPNNTVLRVKFDRKGDLWAGLDLCVVKIRITNPVETFNNKALPIGSGYVLSTVDGKMYLGTNRGLFYVDFLPGADLSRSEFHRVDGLRGQVWGLSKVDNRLFCCHDRGLFVLHDGKAERIGDVNGVWNVVRAVDDPNLAYVGTYSGFYKIHRENGEWKMGNKIGGDDGSCYNFAMESSGVLWRFDGGEGVFRLHLDANKDRIARSENFVSASDGFSLLNDVSISRIDNDIYFSTENGIYRYDSKENKIIHDEHMSLMLGSPRKVRRLKKTGGWLYALTDKEILQADPAGILGLKRIPLTVPEIRTVHEGDVLFDVAPDYVAYPTPLGFSFFDFSEKMDVKAMDTEKARINLVAISSSNDSIVYTCNFKGTKAPIVLDYKDNSIKIVYGTSGDELPGTLYSYRLNDEKWSIPSPLKIKEFTNLHEGDYRFEVRIISPEGTESLDGVDFRILPPWWRSAWAMAAYAVILLALLWFVFWLEKRRVRMHQLEIAREKDAEMARQQADFEWESRLKDHKIVELEKEQLDKELRHKAQEMANVMMSLAHKNETLQTVKKELQSILPMIPRTNSEARAAITDLQGKVAIDIKSDDVLNRVVEEFDLVHNDFIKRLKNRFPDISNNEVLMCAYLKMGLSTKEIAPLLNISIRGVETMRYRIRKKFNLDREESLTDFLQNGEI